MFGAYPAGSRRRPADHNRKLLDGWDFRAVSQKTALFRFTSACEHAQRTVT